MKDNKGKKVSVAFKIQRSKHVYIVQVSSTMHQSLNKSHLKKNWAETKCGDPLVQIDLELLFSNIFILKFSLEYCCY